jgi:uncharacterized protein YkwD
MGRIRPASVAPQLGEPFRPRPVPSDQQTTLVGRTAPVTKTRSDNVNAAACRSLAFMIILGAGSSCTGRASPVGGAGDAVGGGTGTAGAAGTGAGSSTGGAPGAAAGGVSGGAGAMGAGGTPAGGAGVGGAAGAPGGGLGGAGGAAAGMDAAAVCARWTADRLDMGEGTWSGDATSCTAGDLSADARVNTLRLVNLYRWLAALPPVTSDPAHDAEDQACALMMRANNMLSHTPPTTWLCYTAEGADGASNSNISGGRSVASVDTYMTDAGNPTTIGHRRWLLSNSLGPIGIGGTDKASCLWTLRGTGKVGKPWMAWPAAGIIPFAAVSGARGGGVDTTGWSLQSDTINLATAQVTVTMDGVAQPVTVTQLLTGYGSKYAIRFNATGWTIQAGKTYSVAVSGVTPVITYDVQVVACP